MIIALALIVWFAWPGSGWYIVQPNQEGVVLRFGKLERVEGSGFHWKLPVPIEVAETPETERSQADQIGGIAGGSRTETLMLTGDQNIVDLVFEVQWEVGNRENDVSNYLFKIDDPRATLQSVAESAMREVVGQTRLQPVLENDPAIADQVQDVIQRTLDEYEAGIQVTNVLVRTPNLPEDQVSVVALDSEGQPIIRNGEQQLAQISPREAFLDVQDARSERETLIQNATATANSIVPQARGRAARIVEQGRAYKEAVIAEARGEADRFISIFEQYQQFPEVVRASMHKEAVERVLSRSNVVLLDESGEGGTVPYLPLNELIRSRQSNSNQGGQ